MSGDDGEQSKKPAFDLEEGTAAFGESVIGFAKTIPKNPITFPLIDQVVRSGTSVAANYCEADDAVSKKDFRNKIGTCRKEARETKLWLRMIAAAEPEQKLMPANSGRKPRNFTSYSPPSGENYETALLLSFGLRDYFVIRI